MALTERYVSSTADGSGNGTSENSPWTLAQALTNASAGHRVNVKGSFTLSADFSPSNAGTNQSPIVWRGYQTSIGDLNNQTRDVSTGLLSTDTLVNINTNSYKVVLKNYNIFANFYVHGNNANSLVASGNNNLLINIYSLQHYTGASTIEAISLTASSVAINCDARMDYGDGPACAAASYSSFIGCNSYGGASAYDCTDNTLANFVASTGRGAGNGAYLSASSGSSFMRVVGCTLSGNNYSVSTAASARNSATLVINTLINEPGASAYYTTSSSAAPIVTVNSLLYTAYDLYSGYPAEWVNTAINLAQKSTSNAAECVDAANGNFHLRAGALARDAGALRTSIGAYAYDGVRNHPVYVGGI